MTRKRVEAEATDGCNITTTGSMVRAKDGSAFARCEECNKDVPVALISFHSCSLDAKIKMNLAAQVVETPTEVKKKPSERKRGLTTESKAKKAKKEKKDKGPNAPKRPPTAFFLFMDDFRKEYKEANPGSKDVKKVAKEGGERWRSLTDEEKKQYVDKAAELKAEYEKALETSNAEDEDDEGVSPEKEEDDVPRELQDLSDEE